MLEPHYVLISILVFLGIKAGMLISRAVIEEMVPGESYFHLARGFFAGLVFALPLYFLLLPSGTVQASILSLLTVCVTFILLRFLTQQYIDPILSALVGVVLFISYNMGLQFASVASLSFILMIIIGTRALIPFVKGEKLKKSLTYLMIRVTTRNVGFFICFILPFLFS